MLKENMEDNLTMYHVNMVTDEGKADNHEHEDSQGEEEHLPGKKSGNTSMENVCDSSAREQEEGEGGNDNIQSRKRKDDFLDSAEEIYLPPAKR